MWSGLAGLVLAGDEESFWAERALTGRRLGWRVGTGKARAV